MGMHAHKCCNGKRVFKGPWTPEEDGLLINYMKAHAKNPHPWTQVPRYAGLARSAKSCRFRWLEYLDPSLNRKNFSKKEIELICTMQRAIGNRWAEIARHLPGRSDNSIKNFWNTYSQRRLMTNHRNPISPSIHPQHQEEQSSSSNKIQQMLQDHRPFTICNLTYSPIDKLHSTPVLNTSSTNHLNNFQDDQSTLIHKDLPPLPESLSYLADNTSCAPIWEMDSIPTCDQKLFNGVISPKDRYGLLPYSIYNTSVWTNPIPSYNQVQEQPQYYESNNLYDSSLLAPQDVNQLIEDCLFGDSNNYLGNHDLIESGTNVYPNIYPSSNSYSGANMMEQSTNYNLHSSHGFINCHSAKDHSLDPYVAAIQPSSTRFH